MLGGAFPDTAHQIQSMDSSSSSSEIRSSPTVSKEKWAMHARAKLLRGYVLIIANGRRTASFYKEGRGFEPCPFKIAQALVEMGLVEEAGTHFLGTRYLLSAEAPTPPPVVEVADDEEEEEEDSSTRESSTGMDVLLDDLEEEQSDEDEEGDDSAEDASDEDEEESEDDEEDY